MRIPDLTPIQTEVIIDQFEEAKFLKAKGKKIIADILDKYNLTYSQLWNIAVRKNRPHLMRRYDGNQIGQE